MPEEESTHLVFNDKGIFISPDIMPVFNFLMEVEKEVESFLGFNTKLHGISKNYLEMIEFVTFLSNKLKENNINFEFTFKEHPEKVAEKLEFHIPLRSQMIVLFASLDVLFNLHVAYEFETTDEGELRRITMDSDNTKKFLNLFLLSEENQYYSENKSRLSKVDSGKLRDLRNSLTHFFSIGRGGLSLSPSLLQEKARKLEDTLKQDKHGNVVFLSEEDLRQLIRCANILRMRKWSQDFQKDPQLFKNKMQYTIDLVKKQGAIIVLNKETKSTTHG